MMKTKLLVELVQPWTKLLRRALQEPLTAPLETLLFISGLKHPASGIKKRQSSFIGRQIRAVQIESAKHDSEELRALN